MASDADEGCNPVNTGQYIQIITQKNAPISDITHQSLISGVEKTNINGGAKNNCLRNGINSHSQDVNQKTRHNLGAEYSNEGELNMHCRFLAQAQSSCETSNMAAPSPFTFTGDLTYSSFNSSLFRHNKSIMNNRHL